MVQNVLVNTRFCGSRLVFANLLSFFYFLIHIYWNIFCYFFVFFFVIFLQICIFLEKILFSGAMSGLKLLPTSSSSSTSVTESIEKSVKEKGSCFKEYINLSILKVLNSRRINRRQLHNWNSKVMLQKKIYQKFPLLWTNEIMSPLFLIIWSLFMQ